MVCSASARCGPSRPTSPRPGSFVLLACQARGRVLCGQGIGVLETVRPTLILDPGSLLGSLVGQTEERTRQALRIIDAFGPTGWLLSTRRTTPWPGHNSNGDSGVMSRFFGPDANLAQ